MAVPIDEEDETGDVSSPTPVEPEEEQPEQPQHWAASHNEHHSETIAEAEREDEVGGSDSRAKLATAEDSLGPENEGYSTSDATGGDNNHDDGDGDYHGQRESTLDPPEMPADENEDGYPQTNQQHAQQEYEEEQPRPTVAQDDIEEDVQVVTDDGDGDGDFNEDAVSICPEESEETLDLPSTARTNDIQSARSSLAHNNLSSPLSQPPTALGDQEPLPSGRQALSPLGRASLSPVSGRRLAPLAPLKLPALTRDT
jgi:hypothetical protein